MEKIKKIVDSCKDDIVRHTSELIQIKSVEGEEKPGKPFGEGVDKALSYMLDLAKSFGFETANADGFAGHADIGDGDDLVGVLVHLDVVPEGTGWDMPAFGGEVRGNRIYGRGAVDNKGPAVASLFAMKALKESALPLKKRIRLIFGTHEEATSGWSDLNYYFAKYPRPDTGFSPDAEFPVIYGEKGLLNFSLHRTLTPDDSPVQIENLKGGNAPNMVPDYCEAELTVDESFRHKFEDNFHSYIKKSGYPLSLEEREDGKRVLRSKGVSVHASTPEKGTNALSFIFDFLSQCPGLNASAGEFSKNYREKIGFQVNGESIGCQFKDDISGPLTFNAGVAAGDREKIDLSVNIRYPITLEGAKVIEGIKRALEGTGVEVKSVGDVKPLFVPKDDELVQKLMEAYRVETGDYTSGPITIGGGTYARALPKGVAFGALFPGKEMLAHEKNEYIEIEDLISATRIFASALYALAGDIIEE